MCAASPAHVRALSKRFSSSDAFFLCRSHAGNTASHTYTDTHLYVVHDLANVVEASEREHVCVCALPAVCAVTLCFATNLLIEVLFN